MSEIFQNFKTVFFANYTNFQGRARRSELWLYNLVVQILLTLAIFVFLGAFLWSYSLGDASSRAAVPMIVVILLMLIFLLAFLCPSLAVSVRRLHDTGRSGLWMLLAFVPFGSLVVFYFLILDGDVHPNCYGEDPKEEEREYYRNLLEQH